MAKKDGSVREYGAELGAGIKEGLKGINTVCSPKQRKTVIKLILIPLAIFVVFFSIGMATDNDIISAIGMIGGFGLGLYQFYIGKIGKGILYTITMGLIVVGCLIDLFKVGITKTLKDNNGFPILY